MSTTSSKRRVGPETAGIRVTVIVRWELWTASQLERYLPSASGVSQSNGSDFRSGLVDSVKCLMC